jgi:hypothetical protein
VLSAVITKMVFWNMTYCSSIVSRTFQRDLLPSSLSSLTFLPWKWTQHVSPKRWYLSNGLHSFKSSHRKLFPNFVWKKKRKGHTDRDVRGTGNKWHLWLEIPFYAVIHRFSVFHLHITSRKSTADFTLYYWTENQDIPVKSNKCTIKKSSCH